MKNALKLVIAGLLLICQSGLVWAVPQTLPVTLDLSATIPAATGIGMTVSKIVGDNPWVVVAGHDLSFDPMTFIPGTALDPVEIYLPDHFFALDFGAINNLGSPAPGAANITFAYTEGANPNGPAGGHGLGWKSTATFMKVRGAIETPLVSHGGTGKMMLKDMLAPAGTTVPNAEIAGGFLRVYLGIVTKDEAQDIADPDASEPFTNGDVGGSYTGQLAVTAVML